MKDNESDRTERENRRRAPAPPEPGDWETLDEPETEEAEYPPPRRRRAARRERAVVLFADEGGSIIRAGDEALEEDDLPVLNAFRQFLEAERKRARRQLVRLMVLFSIAVLAALAGGVYVVRDWMRQVARGVENEKSRTESIRSESFSNIQTVARAAVTLKRDVMEGAKKSAAVEADLERQRAELARLMDTIVTLEIENAMLQRSVRKIEDEPFVPRVETARPAPEPDFAPPPARAIAPPPADRPSPAPLPEPPARALPAAPAALEPPAPPPAETQAGMTPGGVRFRLPLPPE